MSEIRYTLDQMNLIDTYRKFSLVQYTFFLRALGIVSRINYRKVGHKITLSKFKKTEIIPSIFTNNGVVKLEGKTSGSLEYLKLYGK